MIRIGRTDVLLLLGMLAGAVLAARGVVREASTGTLGMPADAVAMVNGQPVSRSAFDTAVGLVERDRAAAASAEERRRILDRLVDEELLVQRGLELGLVRSDRKLRGDLVAGVIEAAAAQGDGEPGPAELQAFFAANRTLFQPPPPLRLAQVFVATGPRSDEDARTRALAAARRLRDGEDIATVRRDLGDPPSVEVPSAFVPASRLRDTIGTSAASTASQMEPGDVSDPIVADDGYRVLLLLERGAVTTPALDAVREAVTAEYRRQQGEAALRESLEDWRRDSDITLAPVDTAASPVGVIAGDAAAPRSP